MKTNKINEEFAKRFRTLMSNRNLKLKDIANKTGNAVSTISTWRRGQLPKNSKTAQSVAKILKVSYEYLYFGIITKNDDIFCNESECKYATTKDKMKFQIKSHLDMLIKQAEQNGGDLDTLYSELKSKFPLDMYNK